MFILKQDPQHQLAWCRPSSHERNVFGLEHWDLNDKYFVMKFFDEKKIVSMFRILLLHFRYILGLEKHLSSVVQIY